MIYTVTLNPSIDYIVQVDDLEFGATNRAQGTQFFPGGKGINVSRLLANQSIPSKMWGFLGGFTGNYISETLASDALDFTPVSEASRINIKIKGNQETEINAGGPTISEDELKAFKAKFSVLTAVDTVIFSGSMARGLPTDIYQNLVSLVQKSGAQFIIDTTGDALKATLAQGPVLVKPNRAEVAELYQQPIESLSDVQKAGERLIQDGAQHAIISMAGDGAMFFSNDEMYYAPALVGKVVNSVGAGDSMIAGFVGALSQGMSNSECFKYAVASGTATAFSADIAEKQLIDELFNQVTLQNMKES
ncbi:1-phosphofructokinase [Weissella minor]|uniref:1-phosphofructokinase n=1 Tax=Weissella minor TaxID=1620 RepID=UPI003AF204E7